jgi:hypothetical protein
MVTIIHLKLHAKSFPCPKPQAYEDGTKCNGDHVRDNRPVGHTSVRSRVGHVVIRRSIVP